MHNMAAGEETNKRRRHDGRPVVSWRVGNRCSTPFKASLLGRGSLLLLAGRAGSGTELVERCSSQLLLFARPRKNYRRFAFRKAQTASDFRRAVNVNSTMGNVSTAAGPVYRPSAT